MLFENIIFLLEWQKELFLGNLLKLLNSPQLYFLYASVMVYIFVNCYIILEKIERIFLRPSFGLILCWQEDSYPNQFYRNSEDSIEIIVKLL